MRITQDIPCCRCRYNLRTLSRFGACPECGTSVSTSLALLHTRRFKTMRALLLAAVTLHGLLAVGAFALPSPPWLWLYLFLTSGALALGGFAWSACSLHARCSLAVFFGTLTLVCTSAWCLAMSLVVEAAP